MGVTMTPSSGPLKLPVVLATAAIVVALVAVGLSWRPSNRSGVPVSISSDRLEVPRSANESAAPTAEPPARRVGLMMVWAGQSDLGFTRVELWHTNNNNYPHEFVVQATGQTEPFSCKTTLTSMPDGIVTTPSFTTLFVMAPRERSISRADDGILAAVTKEGVLRLFAVGYHQLRPSCELSPVASR